MTELNDWNFDEFCQNKKVITDFWASWCGQCKMLEPLLEEFEKQHPDIPVGRMDADNYMPIVESLNIKGLPTVILWEDGIQTNRHTGYMTMEQLKTFAKVD